MCITYPRLDSSDLHNGLMYKQANRYNAAEDHGLTNSSYGTWNIDMRILSHHDQFLASIDLKKLGGMRRKTKKMRLTHLSKAEVAYRIELKAQKKGQHTMWSYMGLVDPSKEGVT